MSVAGHTLTRPLRRRGVTPQSSTAAGARLLDALLWVGAAAGLGALVLVALFALASLRPVIVTSGSMEPAVPVGALVVVAPTPASAIEVGDVVYAQRGSGHGYLHRVVEVAPAARGAVTLTLQGDANRDPDPAPLTVTEALVARRVLPGLGQIAWLVSSPAAGFVVALVVLGPFLLRR